MPLLKPLAAANSPLMIPGRGRVARKAYFSGADSFGGAALTLTPPFILVGTALADGSPDWYGIMFDIGEDNDNHIHFARPPDTDNLRLFVRTGGTTQIHDGVGAAADGTLIRFGIRIKEQDVSLAVNGTWLAHNEATAVASSYASVWINRRFSSATGGWYRTDFPKLTSQFYEMEITETELTDDELLAATAA